MILGKGKDTENWYNLAFHIGELFELSISLSQIQGKVNEWLNSEDKAN